MCGIAGLLGRARPRPPGHHDRAGSPTAGPTARGSSSTTAGQPRSPPPRDHRPRRAATSPSARADGARAAHLQRRGLQLPRAAGRARAAGHTFHTSCDTEVVLHAYLEWGTDCFARFNGMWALAILDLRDGDRRSAPRARPRPLRHQAALLGAVGLGPGALRVGDQGGARRSRAATSRPTASGSTTTCCTGCTTTSPRPRSRASARWPAATWAVVDADGVHEQVYWEPGARRPTPRNDPAEFRARFERSVERRLVADVPAGTCLSGGIDSSSIVGDVEPTARPRTCPMRCRSATTSRRSRSCTTAIRSTSASTWTRCSPRSTPNPRSRSRRRSEFVSELDRVVWHQDEPIVSTGPYAQWCVMRLAQPKVTVLLNGQGGDELLAGYVPYQYVYLRELLQAAQARARSSPRRGSRATCCMPLVKRRLVRPPPRAPDRAAAAADVHAGSRAAALPARRRTISSGGWSPTSRRSRCRRCSATRIATRWRSRWSPRLPFLDQELVDWVLRLPPSAIVDRGWSRAILREGLRGVLTEKVRTRRWKVGFTTPETRWLRARRAAVQGLFRSPAVLRPAVLGRHCDRRRVRPVLRR